MTVLLSSTPYRRRRAILWWLIRRRRTLLTLSAVALLLSLAQAAWRVRYLHKSFRSSQSSAAVACKLLYDDILLVHLIDPANPDGPPASLSLRTGAWTPGLQTENGSVGYIHERRTEGQNGIVTATIEIGTLYLPLIPAHPAPDDSTYTVFRKNALDYFHTYFTRSGDQDIALFITRQGSEMRHEERAAHPVAKARLYWIIAPKKAVTISLIVFVSIAAFTLWCGLFRPRSYRRLCAFLHRCWGCAYDVTDSTHSCPECGRALEPAPYR